jgi:sortase A
VTPFIEQEIFAVHANNLASSVDSTSKNAQEEWASAVSYNHRMASGEKVPASYSAELAQDHGAMGTVTIPSINVHLTIWHGTGETALENGVGHVASTALPVGGKGTRAVVAAHRGLPDKELFTALDRVTKGDIFYFTVLGHKIYYKVSSVAVVNPNDVASIRPITGKDEATLLTCTPYGVNTQRLLVTGTRTAAPKSLAATGSAVAGWWEVPAIALLGLAWTITAWHQRKWLRGLHCAWIPRSAH